jgi:hypothetical protein
VFPEFGLFLSAEPSNWAAIGRSIAVRSVHPHVNVEATLLACLRPSGLSMRPATGSSPRILEW